jgi:hypothetical protein
MIWFPCRIQVRDPPEWFREDGQNILDQVSELEIRWHVEFRRAVVQVLQGMSDKIGRVVPNACTNNHGLHMDIELPDLVGPYGHPVALHLLEVHFARNTGEPLGLWLARRRLLRLEGYHGVVLTFADWDGGPTHTDVLNTILAECTYRKSRQHGSRS